MARCGCAGNVCTCVILPGNNTEVSGSGSETDPYQVHSRMAKLTTQDTPSIDLTLVGDGSETLPYRLTADLAAVPTTSFGSRNVLENGDMSVYQRGLMGAAGGDIDRWMKSASGGTVTLSRPEAGLGVDAGMNGAPYYAQLVTAGLSGVGSTATWLQRIASARTLAGRVCTLSFLGQSPDSAKVGIELMQHLGTGTGGTYAYYTSPGAIQLSPVWQSYEISFTLPSIAGKGSGAMGSDHNDFLQLYFWLSAGTTYAVRSSGIGIQNATFRLTDIQLEAGAKATTYERLHPVDVLQQCRRWFHRKYNNDPNSSMHHLSNSGYVSATNKAQVDFALAPSLRPDGIGVGVAFDPTLGNYTVRTPGGTYAVQSITQTTVGLDLVTVEVTTTTSTMTVGHPAVLCRTGANPTYVDFSAEL